jgi:LuxR family maltose regulon positive regulatory protein
MSTISLAHARAKLAAARAKSERQDEDTSGPGLIHRTRLANWLTENAADARIAVVQAPAGYGKSQILNLWATELRKTGGRVLRMSCIKSDSQTHHFRVRLARALEHAGLSLDTDLGAVSGPTGAPPVDFLLDEETARLTDESLAVLFDLALGSQNVRLTLASRRKISHGLARSRTQGHVAVLDPLDIAFDRAEVRTLLERAAGTIDHKALDTVMTHTGGWPPAIRHLASPTAELPPEKAVELLAGRCVIADFFAEEVMAGLPGELVTFLQSVAILERLHPALCNAITGAQDSQDCIDRLCNEGLFVLKIDDGAGWYRLHPLLAAYLRGLGCTVSAEVRHRQHLHAFEWFDQAGLFVEAFDHAMSAGEPEHAARVFHAHAGDFYMSGLETSIVPTASRLPVAVREHFPRIMLAMSWRLMAEFRFGLAYALLEAAETRIREICTPIAFPAKEKSELQQDVRHCRIMGFMFREDFAALDREAGALMREIEHQRNPYMVMSLYAAMMYSQGEQFHMSSHERLEALAREHLSAVPSRYVHVLFESMAAPGRLLRGEAEATVALLQNAFDTAVEISGRASAFPSTVALTLAEALYMQNDIARADELLNEYLPYATDVGYVDQLISGYLTRSRIQRLRGGADAALETLQSAEAVAEERGFERLRSSAGAERIALLCHLNRAAEAEQVAQWHGLKLSSPPPGPTVRSTRAGNSLAMAWVRLAQSSGHIAEAQTVAKAWRSHAYAARAVTAIIDWDIVRAQLLLAVSEETSACRIIFQALALAAPARRIRAFADEASRLIPVFKALASGPLSGDGFEPFAASVIAAIEAERGQPLCRPSQAPLPADEPSMTDLTARELAILKLAAAGNMNVEIGNRLGLTPGTVKWYLHKTYRKLGCQRRTKAIDVGRRLGLID